MNSTSRPKVFDYFSLIKFSHTIFALPFAFIGFLLGAKEKNFQFEWKLPILVLLCMVFARSAAMAFNRWADRDFDAKNHRTLSREIPSGKITAESALIFVIINAVLFIVCTFFINRICFFLSPIALLIVLGYSYTKRFTSLSHLVLGLGLSLAPIGAYLAVTGDFKLLPLLFSIAVLTWVSGFDIIYALQDIKFDKENKLNSIPSRLGIKGSMRASELLHLFASLVLLLASFYGKFSWIYLCGWGVFTALLIYQHTLVKSNDLSRVNLAFFTTNGIASVVFAGFVAFEIL
ncbi:MAG TPA: UbiA-like polyprenyltransferase [Bacteroidia bacterium]|nr:UbiA-like polyprenyltransferase [Bacteroidia bacterium]